VERRARGPPDGSTARDPLGAAPPTSARGQLLLPWPNRLHTGRYCWDGAAYQVPLNEPDQRNAIHGLTRWRSWTGDQGLRLRPGERFAASWGISPEA
jgi:galactose mutarotase-like enzyme